MKNSLFLLLVFALGIQNSYAQSCSAHVTIVLATKTGGRHKGQTVFLEKKSGEKIGEQVSDENGEVVFRLPCNNEYVVTTSNNPNKKPLRTSQHDGAQSTLTLTYDPNIIEKQKAFDLTESEKKIIDQQAALLPDTTSLSGASMTAGGKKDLFSCVTIKLTNLDGKPLVGESLWLTGNKRGKSFKGKTDSQGRIILWLPKGDTYSLNFKYNLNYSSIETGYTKDSSNITSSFSYLGTKEIELRKKQEAERILAEEKRLKALEKKFAEDCKKRGISLEDGKKLEIAKYIAEMDQFSDPVILSALVRNHWDEKLIVCDLTGSMSPYAAQLSIWYQLHYKKEKNLQFVFFNDGDAKADSDKKIGETGGIYYSPSKGIYELANLMNKVAGAGSGGDCPENNMEALIKGHKMAAPYKELVMIVDNQAPVKDIALLKNFNRPVHIILCGYDNYVAEDYLLIAWKTKGSLHTIEQDITSIASMSEGDEVIVKGIRYKIMGGAFIRIDKL